MKATVFIDTESEEPTLLTGDEAREEVADLYGPHADYDIVSEWSLELAVSALQHVYNSSACPSSRATAERALRRIGETGDLETDATGKPVPIDARKLLNELANPWTANPSDA